MSLYQQILEDVKTAMKNRDSATLEVLRLLTSNLKNLIIESRRELEDADVLAAIKRDVKKLQDAIVDYSKGARQDLVDKANSEVAILKSYLPAEMGDDELMEKIKAVLAQNGITSKADIGKAMGTVMKELAAAADGTRVREFVQKILS